MNFVRKLIVPSKMVKMDELLGRWGSYGLAEITAMVGLSRSTVNRYLKELEEAGLVEVEFVVYRGSTARRWKVASSFKRSVERGL